MLKTIKIEEERDLQRPFELIDPKEVIPIIYKWLSERKGRLTTIQLRMHDPSHCIMHYVGLRAHRRHVYVLYVHDLQSNQQQITHVWKPLSTYENLTAEEIKASVDRAKEINHLTAIKQASNDPSMTDALPGSWIPEVKEKLPQITDLEILHELLNTQ